nr:PREDICTED: uncharacterized protein LOC106705815 isoform X2 [Latimeria chalumnae]|eukprot:XP_014351302.1 PREDICTED: uncharacterized protein LOC106705815 isoform X2 [Latimeria chalumnae]
MRGPGSISRIIRMITISLAFCILQTGNLGSNGQNFFNEIVCGIPEQSEKCGGVSEDLDAKKCSNISGCCHAHHKCIKMIVNKKQKEINIGFAAAAIAGFFFFLLGIFTYSKIEGNKRKKAAAKKRQKDKEITEFLTDLLK